MKPLKIMTILGLLFLTSCGINERDAFNKCIERCSGAGCVEACGKAVKDAFSKCP